MEKVLPRVSVRLKPLKVTNQRPSVRLVVEDVHLAIRHRARQDGSRNEVAGLLGTVGASVGEPEALVVSELGRRGLRDDVDAGDVQAPAPGASPGARAAGREFLDRLVEEVAKLPPEQREVVALRFLESLSYAEIAEALGCPLGTVQSRLHAGVRALREKLGGFR